MTQIRATEKPDIGERLVTSVGGRNLRACARRLGDIDLAIARGRNKSRFGSLLIRLQAEWDGSERRIPKKPTRREIQAVAQVEIKNGIRKVTKESMEEARERLEQNYTNEMARILGVLKSLPEASKVLAEKVPACAVDDPALPMRLLLHWLDPVCKVCNGRCYQLAPCKTKLSERACGGCGGAGLTKHPAGDIGQKALAYMDDTLDRTQSEVRRYCRG